MRDEILLAGSGGQGVLLIGEVLARAALLEGKETCWFPIYSPEVRGGTSTCTVIIADETVGSPISGRPRVGVMLNQRAMDDHGASVRAGGLLLSNASLVRHLVDRDDVAIYELPATDLAREQGAELTTNLVMLGACLAVAGSVSLEALPGALQATLPERHHKLIPVNLRSIEAGAEYVRQHGPTVRKSA